MKTNSSQLLQALNAAAAVLQQTTRSEKDVLDTCREEIARLGFRQGIPAFSWTATLGHLAALSLGASNRFFGPYCTQATVLVAIPATAIRSRCRGPQ